jgi:ABC-2 type transport system ATP-binding protein
MTIAPVAASVKGEAVVQVDRLVKRFGTRVVLHDVGFEIRAGEVLGFIGPNGSGKTTTIRCIAGLMRMDAGSVRIQGHDVHADFERAIAEVGCLVENPEFYKYMSGLANLKQFARMYPDVDASRVERVVARVGLEKRIRSRVKTYSLGMRQRLGIAQAILHRPTVLLLDEPANGLDPEGIRDLRLLLRSLADEEGMAILVSSHLLSELEQLCDRVVVLRSGRVIGEGDMASMLAATGSVPCEVAFTVGSPAHALEVLGGARPGLARLEGETVVVTCLREEVPEKVAALVGAGIAVLAVIPSTASLEDRYLQMAGGGGVE